MSDMIDQSAKRAGGLQRVLMLVVCYGLLWAMFSGLTDALPVIAGVISVFLVLVLSGRMDVVHVAPAKRHLRWWRLPAYLLRLLTDIIISNIIVARIILSPRLTGLDPRLLRVPAGQKNAIALMVHANSITLTPGTLSLRLEPGVIFVHSLRGSERALENGDLDRRVSRLEGGA